MIFEKKSSWPRSILIFPGLLLLVIIVLLIFRVGDSPDIMIEPGMPMIGKRTPLKVEVSEPQRGLKHVKIELMQEDKSSILTEKSYQFRPWWAFWGTKNERDTIQLEVGSQTIPDLKGGSATIRVSADRVGTWIRHPDPAIQEVSLQVRLIPPSLQVTSSKTYVAQGGCEAVVYRVDEYAVRDGVRSGSWWFPGFPLPGGGKGDRFAFFAVPYDMAEPDVRLVAMDAAGNEAETAFIDRFFPKRFKQDTIDISESFLSKVVPEILSQSPEIQDRGNLLDNYLAINGELRQKNAEMLESLPQQSQPVILWTKPFIALENGQVTAGFADHRTYNYNGRVIDHQDHLGYDLASIRQSPIPAANDGIVLYARYFGIYGNAVIIDHGIGLMSLYGHLSSIAVKEGQKVARGDIIGNTGESGLAGGDHLHFSMLLQGLSVNPVEWWDAHWIQDRIARKLASGKGDFE